MKYTGIEEIKKELKKREMMPIQKYRYFSVLMPIIEKDGELHVLFEVRARKMKHQPGENVFREEKWRLARRLRCARSEKLLKNLAERVKMLK